MKRVTTLLTAALVALVLITSGSASADGNGYGKQKVVYHINYDNPKHQAGALRNIQNHINAVGAGNLDLKVVLHGKGLTLLLEPEALERTKFKRANATDEVQATISHLKDQGVTFNVCANTLRGKKVNYETDLYDVDKPISCPAAWPNWQNCRRKAIPTSSHSQPRRRPSSAMPVPATRTLFPAKRETPTEKRPPHWTWIGRSQATGCAGVPTQNSPVAPRSSIAQSVSRTRVVSLSSSGGIFWPSLIIMSMLRV